MKKRQSSNCLFIVLLSAFLVAGCGKGGEPTSLTGTTNDGRAMLLAAAMTQVEGTDYYQYNSEPGYYQKLDNITAESEIHVLGSVVGDLNRTKNPNEYSNNDKYEIITETTNSGWPKYNFLEHRWKFTNVRADKLFLVIKGHQSVSPDSDQFQFWYSKDDVDGATSFYRVITGNFSQTNVSDPDWMVEIPNVFITNTSECGKSVWIKMIDTNRDYFKTQCDSMYIDHMYLEPYVRLDAHTPNPQNNATWGQRNQVLTWIPGYTAQRHKVFFAEQNQAEPVEIYDDEGEVNNYDPNDPNNTKALVESCTIPQALEYGKTYKWRVDTIDASGQTRTGEEWQFSVNGLSSATIPNWVEPVGGGEGYQNITTPPADQVPSFRVISDSGDNNTNIQNLLTALNDPAISTVYLADTMGIKFDSNAMALLTNNQIVIPAGKTLASGRGRVLESGSVSRGAIIRRSIKNADGSWDSENYDKGGASSLFLVNGAGVRITGLRLEGPSAYHEPDYYQDYLPEERRQISGTSGNRCISSAHNVEVDNCELYNWSYACINIPAANEGAVKLHSDHEYLNASQYIHHNYIHDNGGPMGYGIEITEAASPLIEANVFNRCRHAIAGSGDEGVSYEAAYNIVMEGKGIINDNNPSHQFDMHAERENEWWLLHWYAGSAIEIHDNSFTWYEGLGVCIRGKPRIAANVRDNWFLHKYIGGYGCGSGPDLAVKQTHYPGNMNVQNNFVTPARPDLTKAIQGTWTTN